MVVVVLPLSAASRRFVDDTDTVPIPGNVSPRLSGAVDVGRTNGAIPAERMILLLRPRAGASERLERLLEEQLDPASPNYHHWLTPDEYGRAFGIPDEDLNAVLAWLQRNGFSIDEVARGRGWINFSGTVAEVEATFRTQMRDVIAGGRLHHANVRDPEVPRALADVVGGVASLHDFFKVSRPRPRPSIAFTDGSDGLGPADFATIYDTAPLLAAGVDGRGQTIAVVAQSNIKIADVQQFRSFFGLPALDPVITVNGPDPGIVTDDEGEADLDVEWAGGVAPGATVNLVVSKTTFTDDGVDLSAQYIVDQNLAPIVTYSYGTCESDLGTSGLQFYAALWQQAAAQGMTVFVASGDSGAAGCDDPTMATVGTGLGVNGLASTPYDVCVGGTQFADPSSSQYWSASNSPGTRRSVKAYVPEQAWNESGSVSGGSGIWAGSGGPSTHFTKPSWQSAPGVPSDGVRDTPDVSLDAASSVGYVAFSEYVPGSDTLSVFSGTSASAQCFGGIMALVNQKSGGGRQGNPNPVFYRLATAQYGDSGAAVFHDVTTGNNSVPGVVGFSAGPGYDLATGLGSVDVAALVNSFAVSSGPVANFSFTPASPVVGQTVLFTDESTGSPTSWSWNFGDGATSTVQNPTHNFGTGTYQVSLTVSDSGGSSTKTEAVVVSPRQHKIAYPSPIPFHPEKRPTP
ncbi:MAG: protease pro-enzyme activation domain-containing protein [Solirubrobacterales bacterium]